MRSYVLFIGGHHTSSVPIIKRLMGSGIRVRFIGHKFASSLNTEISSEYKEITSLGVDFIHLKSPKFYNVSGIYKYVELFVSTLKCVWLLINYRPKLVVSFGGYLAVPVSLAAFFLRVKIYHHEQTAGFGMASALVEKLANKVYLTWDTRKNDDKYQVIGIPLRDEIKQSISKDLSNYTFSSLLILGGKQGSHIMNDFVFKNISTLTKNYNVVHQTSRHSQFKDYEKGVSLAKRLGGKYEVHDYIFGTKLTKILNQTSFVLSRAGAHTVYELSYLGMPTIFVPIPWVSKNEQKVNADIATKYIPSDIISENELTLAKFLGSVEKLKSLSKKSFTTKVPENADTILFEAIKKNFD